jgi:D-sedoheptulose 7-phosphate isomerase
VLPAVANVSAILRRAIDHGIATLRSLGELEPELQRAADLIATCLTSGGKLLVSGNGGSAADAADFCTEFACRFVEDRRPYPAMNLSQGGSLITATANDYGFDEIFARQVAAFGNKGDVLIAISTSGKSANIRRALEEAGAGGLQSIALLGRDGGDSRRLADIDLIVAGDSTPRIQEAHKFLLHVLCEAVEGRLTR